MTQVIQTEVHRANPRLPFTGFRPDIQGLRAIAVGVVLLYHANAPFLPGGFVGVDVFFVISGYLITGLLLREALSTGGINLADFYGRRARRILPAATIVIIVTLLLTVFFLPQIRWQQVGIDAIGAALYVVNWVYAGGTDYLNADVAASPLQHFWTLSVEEQFYIIWPLVLVVLLLAIRGGTVRALRASGASQRTPDPSRVMRFAGFGVLALLVPSLLWSIYFTATNPAPAYFVTTTRLWELSIGAALAVFARYAARIPDRGALLLGWAGLAGIVVASVMYTSEVPDFPGSAALLPTLSAAAIIAGGMNGRAERGVGRFLGLRPMRWVGDISYSLYLWHWPFIVVGTYLLGDTLRFRWGLVIVILSFIPSWLSYKYVEGPFRDWPRLKQSIRASLLSGAALMTATVIVAVAVIVVPRWASPQIEVESGQRLGAEALTDDFSDDDISTFTDAGKPVDTVEGGFTPTAVDAREDNPVVYEQGCHVDQEATSPLMEGCNFGNPESETTVVLVGDSHGANWAPTLIELAERHDWNLRVATKSACGFSAATQTNDGVEYESCVTWNKNLLDQLGDEKPNLVIVSNSSSRASIWENSTLVKGEPALQLFADGLRDNIETLEAAGIPVLMIKDTPRLEIDVPECVSANPTRLTECAVDRAEAVDDRPQLEKLAVAGLSDKDQVDVIDMNNWVCPDLTECAAIIGNVLVWRDGHHFTQTFAETLVEPLDAALQRSPLARSALSIS